MRKRSFLLAGLAGAVLVGGGAFWLLTAPQRLDAAVLSAVSEGDAARGERIFNAAGCSSCHSRPGAPAEERLALSGGLALKTPFGIFVAPNISSDPQSGIGAWSAEDFANAVMRGVSPDGRHYYPAFPYTSYARMRPSDVGDLWAYMKTLPAVEGEAPASDVAFPFSIRRGIGFWKRLHLDMSGDPVVVLAADAPEDVRAGRYLVEGPGHCGECHTPRDLSGGLDLSAWLSGAKAAEGDGNVPNITPGEGGIGDWSASDIAYFLESGFTPDFDSVGGSMTAVVRNLGRLPEADRQAIAAYLKAVPALPRGK